MDKKTIKDVDVNGKKVFVRVDYNVPFDAEQNITNDTRMVRTLPTLKAPCVCKHHRATTTVDTLPYGGRAIIEPRLVEIGLAEILRYNVAPNLETSVG